MSNAGIGTPYWYEWEVGLLECLKMMTNPLIESVVLQSDEFTSLDDVVVNLTNNQIINIQVKNTDIKDNFTYAFLESGRTPLLKNWAEEWKTKKSQYNITEIKIVTNRSWGPISSNGKCSFRVFVNEVFPLLKKNYDFPSKDPSITNAILWFKSQLSSLSPSEQVEFVRVLNFYHEEDLLGVKNKIQHQIQMLIGNDNDRIIKSITDQLLAQLNIWATSIRGNKKEITREDIYKALTIVPKTCARIDLLPQKPILPSRIVFAKDFTDIISNGNEKIYFLTGLPGSGKTNFVSYLSQVDNSVIDFRFYTYLPVNSKYSSYSDDQGFYSGELLWKSILNQLFIYFEKNNLLNEVQFPIIFDYMDVSTLRENALKFLPIYASKIGHCCYVFIDGLDHAARSFNSRNSFLAQLPTPDEIQDQVKIVLVGQPTFDIYPSWLRNNPKIRYISLPVLSNDDVEILINKYCINNPQLQVNNLSTAILDLVGNNTLNILFALQDLSKCSGESSFETITSYLSERHLDQQIDKYYDWIFSYFQENNSLVLKIKVIFAFSSRKIPLGSLASICESNYVDTVFVLNKLFPLIISDDCGYYVFHNDVRLYLKSTIIKHTIFPQIVDSIYQITMRETSLNKYKYDYLFGMLYELPDNHKAFELLSPDYIIQSVNNNVSITTLIKQLELLSQHVCKTRSLNNINLLSLSSSTICQFIINVQYNGLENKYLDDTSFRGKKYSEKYVLDTYSHLQTIVKDIACLITDGHIARAEALFHEHLDSFSLNDYLSYSITDTKVEFYKNCGIICRHFSPIIINDTPIDKKAFTFFMSGWLEGSIFFNSLDDLIITFKIVYFQKIDVNNFTKSYCINQIPSEEFGFLSNLFVSKKFPISSVIDLCTNGIIYNHNVSILQDFICSYYSELETSDEFEYKRDRIIYFIKLLFCIYSRDEKKDTLLKLYRKLLFSCNINNSDREFFPAIRQLVLSCSIFDIFYRYKNDSHTQVKNIIDVLLFTRKYGFGASDECNAFSVMNFLTSIIVATYQNNTLLYQTDISNICQTLERIFCSSKSNPIYDTHISNLFILGNERERFYNVYLAWAGNTGFLWNCDYSSVECIGKNLISLLTYFDYTEDASNLQVAISSRLFAYVDHKDYSISSLLETFKLLPLSEEKLCKYGMELLSISDMAQNIGDNRISNELEQYLFEVAASLGMKYASALYNLKNTPNEFYYWRTCFLNEYYNRINNTDFSDDELIAWYNLVNAWIDVDIESSSQYGTNQCNFLYLFNDKIINCIKDEPLRHILFNRGNCTPNEPLDIAGIISYKENDFSYLLESISSDGYSQNIEEQIISLINNQHCNLTDLLISISSMIDSDLISGFIDNCVIKYIISRCSYGFRGSGTEVLLEKLSNLFSNDNWANLFEHIVCNKNFTNIGCFYGTTDDIDIICRYYYLWKKSTELSNLLTEKIEMHKRWITMGNTMKFEPYSLNVDNSIITINDFLNVQLGFTSTD